MSENALVPMGQMTIAEVMSVGKTMAQSGYFSDAKDAAQAVVKILAGREMGFGPFASMTGIHIIQGKPAIGGNLMAAAVKSHPKYDYRLVELSDSACEVAFFQGASELGRSRFTMADAEAAGLKGKENWRKFARNMLFNRAMSNGVRWYCPDVFLGAPVYTPDELGADVDEEGVVINITPTVTKEPEPFVFNPEFPEGIERWSELHAMAIVRLGYNHENHVKNTLKKVFNGDNKNLTFEAAWQALVEHQMSKVIEQTEADATEEVPA